MPWRKSGGCHPVAGGEALLSPSSFSSQQPRLMRQRRLRHLNDLHVEGVGGADAGLISALVPQPLPLPTGSATKGSPNSGNKSLLSLSSLKGERTETVLSAESSPTILDPHSTSICRRLGCPAGVSPPAIVAAEKLSSGVERSPLASPSEKGSGPRLSNVHPLPLPPGATGTARRESTFTSAFWQKGKLIGGGTFGNVYVATNRRTGALCVMKEVNMIPDDPKSAECITQLEQEIKVLSQLKHRNIVQYYGSEIVDDRFYIYLEYVYPGSINKYARERCGAITESIVRSFTEHILRGLAYLHSKNTIHRDIKGANLLVDSSGVVKLADFGMATRLNGAGAVNSLKGSPHWMAPEVVQSAMSEETGYDLKVDIWSLGCTIIEMFTGKHPWHGFDGPQAMFQVLLKSPMIPESLSPEGRDFLHCCFRRSPSDRPTASQLLDHCFIRGSRLPPDNLFSRLRQPGAILHDFMHSTGDGMRSKGEPPSTGKQQNGVRGRLFSRRKGSIRLQLLV